MDEEYFYQQKESNEFILIELYSELSSLLLLYRSTHDRIIKNKILNIKKDITKLKYYFCV
jgi:DNA-directed RNA polymerase specialized sigma54-like protein